MEGHTELVFAGLLGAVAALVTLARVLSVPYPIFLVLGGLAIGFIPGVPEVELEPDLVLVLFLPPLLYSAAFFTSLRDLRRNVRPISLLSIGLVLATCVGVALVAREVIPGMSWPAAFLLGAIVSPTDPVAATALASRLGLPRRVVTVVEGEALINDATAITAYRVALAAVVSGSFGLVDAGGRFLVGAVGGIAIGLAVGWVVAWVRERIDDPPVEITISLLTAYLAYLPAEELELSGVVAAVTAGLYMGSQTSRVTTTNSRLAGYSMWELLTFLLNSVLFILIGLQLPGLLDELREADIATGTVILWGACASLAVIVIRIVWVFVLTYLPRRLFASVRESDPAPPARTTALVAWMGMRGAVSLAAALALPTTLENGAPFTERPVIIFIAFCVILATLVLQGLSLQLLVRALHIEEDDDGFGREEVIARKRAARAALEQIEALSGEEWARDDTLERLRGLYRYRYNRYASRFDEQLDQDGIERRSADFLRVSFAIIQAQRDELDRLRRDGTISDEVMRVVERELDLEEQRFPAAQSPGG